MKVGDIYIRKPNACGIHIVIITKITGKEIHFRKIDSGCEGHIETSHSKETFNIRFVPEVL